MVPCIEWQTGGNLGGAGGRGDGGGGGNGVGRRGGIGDGGGRGEGGGDGSGAQGGGGEGYGAHGARAGGGGGPAQNSQPWQWHQLQWNDPVDALHQLLHSVTVTSPELPRPRSQCKPSLPAPESCNRSTSGSSHALRMVAVDPV